MAGSSFWYPFRLGNGFYGTMIILLSPSKTIDFDALPTTDESTRPRFHADANRLASVLQGYPPKKMAQLMSVSEALAEKTCGFYSNWKKKYDAQGSRQAIFAYQGDVYTGLQAASFSDRNLVFAQQHLRVLSGLYGVLRPLDLIQPYRLEMGTRLQTDKGKDLYAYWGDRITRSLGEDLEASGERVVVNLASAEYFKAASPAKLDARIITPTFKEEKEGKFRFLSMFGKRARGLMARYVIEHQIKTVKKLAHFNEEGYRLNQSLSEGDQLVFTRKQR